MARDQSPRTPSSLHPVVPPAKHHRAAAAWLGLLLAAWWAVGAWLLWRVG